jgi:hypothetical protein
MASKKSGEKFQPQYAVFASRIEINIIPRKAANCDFSLAMNTNSCVAQACNSLLFRAFAPYS